MPWVLALASLQLSAHSKEPSPDPIARVESGSHSGPIFWVEPFPDESRIASASYDRTVRIWRGRDLQLLQTLRIPIEVEREGKLSAVAVSPDGTVLAAGGWTCWAWETKGCVYLFETKTGRLIHRIGNLPNIIGNLRFSPDGKALAVGMHGGGGLLFLDAKTFAVLGKDPEYGERIAGLAFSASGHAVAGALDGQVRLYDRQFRLTARLKIPGIELPGAVYFSPDDTRLLVGAFDAPIVRILSSQNWAIQQTLDVRRENAQISLRNAVWSRSGRYIYAVGDSHDTRVGRIFRWNLSQPARYDVIPVPAHRIQSMRPFGQDGLVFSTEDAYLGIVDDRGQLARTSARRVMDFPQGADSLRVSSDGTVVSFPTTQEGAEDAVFDTAHLEFATRDKATTGLRSARTQSPAFALKEWRNAQAPFLNGEKLELDPFELVRCFAISPDDSRIVLGTEWALRAYDRSGEMNWRSPVPGVVWNVAVSGDGRFAVATLSDGTVRWYRMADGREVLALFVRRDGQEWVLWRPDGYYASSEQGDELIGWHINRGKDAEPDFFRAVQFERQFYRPDLLRGQVIPTTRRRETGALSIQQLRRIAPPRLRIASSSVVGDAEHRPQLELTVGAEKTGRAMTDITVYADLLPVIAFRERQLKFRETAQFQRSFRIPLSSGDHRIRVEVNNGVSLGLIEQLVEIPAAVQTPPPDQGDLYVLAIGVNRFVNIPPEHKTAVPDLQYAVNDASRMAELFQAAVASGGFRKVEVKLLADHTTAKPSHGNILKALRFFERAGPNDTALLFLASHGFSDRRGNYYFIPRDGQIADVDAVLTGQNLTGRARSLLSWTDFLDGLRQAAGRRVLIVDTCNAENIFGAFDAKSLRKRSAASLFPLLLAARGDELSQGYPPARQGAFTYALLEGLRGPADRDRDRNITVGELHAFALPRVPELLRELQNPGVTAQTPQLIAPDGLEHIALRRGVP